MGYRGGSLVDFVQAAQEPTRRVARAVADAGGAELTARAAEHTPERTGALKRQWRQLPVEPARGGGWTSGTENPSRLAHLVEFGVEPHEIEPDDEQAVTTPEGPRARVREHPGHGGAHMLARAVQDVEVSVDRLARPHLERWAGESEANAAKHPGIEMA